MNYFALAGAIFASLAALYFGGTILRTIIVGRRPHGDYSVTLGISLAAITAATAAWLWNGVFA